MNNCLTVRPCVGKKNGSFGFLSVGLCVGKNQMCHLCGWLFTLSDNVPRVAEVAVARNEHKQFGRSEA